MEVGRVERIKRVGSVARTLAMAVEPRSSGTSPKKSPDAIGVDLLIDARHALEDGERSLDHT